MCFIPLILFLFMSIDYFMFCILRVSRRSILRYLWLAQIKRIDVRWHLFTHSSYLFGSSLSFIELASAFRAKVRIQRHNRSTGA
ncbi:hypothetical protein D3C76_1710090 [compost metagenome]